MLTENLTTTQISSPDTYLEENGLLVMEAEQTTSGGDLYFPFDKLRADRRACLPAPAGRDDD